MEQEFFNDESEQEVGVGEQVEEEEVPVIGRVNRSIFWSVMLVALMILGGMGILVSRGAVAMAATLPVPFTVQASTLQANSFRLYPGLSKADNSTPVGVNQIDGTIKDLTISKTITMPVMGDVTVAIKAGHDTPVNVAGLTTDVSALSASGANFQNQSISSNANGNAFEIDASSATLTSANINSPYLFANSITLPGLSLSISH